MPKLIELSLTSPSKTIITGEHFFFYTGKAILKKFDNCLCFLGGLITLTNLSLEEVTTPPNLPLEGEGVVLPNLEKKQAPRLEKGGGMTEEEEGVQQGEGYIFPSPSKGRLGGVSKNQSLKFHLLSLKIKGEISFEEIKIQYGEIISQYKKFLENKIDLKKVLSNEGDFFLLIVGFFIKNYDEFITDSFEIEISETKGYISSKGLGSSASFIVGIIRFLDTLFNLKLKKHEIFEIAVLFENLKHGKTSGIDILCILEDVDDFISIEKKQNLNSLEKYENILDLYQNFRENISKNYNFFLHDFQISKLDNSLVKNIIVHKSFSKKNKFSTFDIIKIVNQKKDYISQNLSKVTEIFLHIQKALEDNTIDPEDRKKMFIKAIEENNQILYNLDIIPNDDMIFIQKMKQDKNLIGKITGSGGIKNINKSVGSIIFFELF